MQGELRRGAGGKVADKNIEVMIMVCNQDGEVIPVSLDMEIPHSRWLDIMAVRCINLLFDYLL